MLKAGGACNYRRIEWINIQMMVHHFVCAMYTCWRFVTFCGFDTLTFWYSWEIIRTGSVREVGRMMACREVGRQIISDSGLDYLRDWRKDARSRGELPAAGSLTVFGLIWLLALGKPPTHKPSARSSGVPWQFVCLGHQGLPHVSIWWWFQIFLCGCPYLGSPPWDPTKVVKIRRHGLCAVWNKQILRT